MYAKSLFFILFYHIAEYLRINDSLHVENCQFYAFFSDEVHKIKTRLIILYNRFFAILKYIKHKNDFTIRNLDNYVYH